MAISTSITTRPINGSCNFNAVGNPINYVFTTTGITTEQNFRIEVEVFKASDNTSLLGITFSFTPDSGGITTANISTIVKGFLSADWSLPAAVNEVEATTSLEVYIKWQELWDGSSTSVQNDVANPIIPMFATNQISTANGANMLDYYTGSATKKWLTLFRLNSSNSGLLTWPGWPFTLSFIWGNGLTGLQKVVEEYDASDAILISTKTSLTDHANTVNRLDVLRGITLNSATTKLKLSLLTLGSELVTDPDLNPGTGWLQSGPGATWNPFSGSADVHLGTVNSIAKQLYTTLTSAVVGKKLYSFEVSLLWVAGTPSGVLLVRLTQSTNNVYVFQKTFSSISSHADNKSYVVSVLVDDTLGADMLSLNAFITNPTTSEDLIVTTILQSVKISTQLSEQITIDVRDACDYDSDNNVIYGNNPVMLEWKNSLGGDAFWLFDKYHEYSYSYSNGKKAKRLLLFAKELSLVQWEAINELNTIGEIYSQNITTLSSSVLGTSKRVGTQVYMIDASGNRTAVIVLPASEKGLMQNTTNNISIEIELPEILSI
jgi:hypothetical protein